MATFNGADTGFGQDALNSIASLVKDHPMMQDFAQAIYNQDVPAMVASVEQGLAVTQAAQALGTPELPSANVDAPAESANVAHAAASAEPAGRGA